MSARYAQNVPPSAWVKLSSWYTLMLCLQWSVWIVSGTTTVAAHLSHRHTQCCTSMQLSLCVVLHVPNYAIYDAHLAFLPSSKRSHSGKAKNFTL